MFGEKKLLKFEKAKETDIPELVAIEKEFFDGYSRIFDEVNMTKWFYHNPDMFYVVKDNNDEIKAFTIITPVTDELYTKLRNGEVTDLFDFKGEEVPTDFNSDFYYIADACVKGKSSNLGFIKIAGTLLINIAKILKENAKLVITSPITDASKNLCSHLNFKLISSEMFEGKECGVYELECSDQKYEELIKNRKGISR